MVHKHVNTKIKRKITHFQVEKNKNQSIDCGTTHSFITVQVLNMSTNKFQTSVC